MFQKIASITPLVIYNDLQKIAKGDYRNRDSRLAAVDARMTRLESELADYAQQSKWDEEELREWNRSLARKIKEGKADLGPRACSRVIESDLGFPKSGISDSRCWLELEASMDGKTLFLGSVGACGGAGCGG